MAIPISYSWRNLVERKTTTVMTALGIGLTVAVLLAAMAMAEGLRASLNASGHPLHVLVMRKGGTAELTSIVTRTAFQDMKLKPGVARTSSGEPMASLELVTVVILESPDRPAGININLRGLTRIGFEMRPDVRIIAGRMFEVGKRELVVGQGIESRYPEARLGGKLRFGRGEWRVVGVVDAGGGAANSEIFADLNQLSSDQNRDDALSSVLLRATDEASLHTLIADLENDRRLNATAMTEKSYYAAQTSSAQPIRFLGMSISLIMAIGSSFAAMNTMYAAVARRGAEIGTLRVLGFSRIGILTSFLVESLLLAGVGGVLGILLVLPLNGITTGFGNMTTFSETSFQFQVTPALMLAGMVFSLTMGAMGGLFPAGSAARKEILDALRGA